MPDPSAFTNATSSHDPSVEWNAHEHIAPAVELEAQRLIDKAGSPDLAKQAVDAASQHLAETSAPDQFVEQCGFSSRSELLASSSQLIAPDGTPWWVTNVRTDTWIVWNEQNPTTAQQFSSLEAVHGFVGQAEGHETPK
jgi:hypothetical protein